jgi:hypothetical protein
MRHEREVHGMHGGPKNTVNCPYANCKRHKGKGFSRQENLNEHIRRLHGVGGVVPEVARSSSLSGTPPPQPQPQQHHNQSSSPREDQQQSQQRHDQQHGQQHSLQAGKQAGKQAEQPAQAQAQEPQSSSGNRPSSKRSRSPIDDDGGNNERRMRRLDRENWELREMILALEREKMAMRKRIDELVRKLEGRPPPVLPDAQNAAVQAPTPAKTVNGEDAHQRHEKHDGRLDVKSDGHMV